MCVCVCVRAHTHTHVRICMHACIHTRACLRACIHARICVCVSMYAHIIYSRFCFLAHSLSLFSLSLSLSLPLSLPLFLSSLSLLSLFSLSWSALAFRFGALLSKSLQHPDVYGCCSLRRCCVKPGTRLGLKSGFDPPDLDRPGRLPHQLPFQRTGNE